MCGSLNSNRFSPAAAGGSKALTVTKVPKTIQQTAIPWARALMPRPPVPGVALEHITDETRLTASRRPGRRARHAGRCHAPAAAFERRPACEAAGGRGEEAPGLLREVE